MSRQIDMTRPPTEEELEYLSTRADGAGIVTILDRKFDGMSDEEKDALRDAALADEADEAARKKAQEQDDQDEEDDSFDEEDVRLVAPLTVKELRQKLEKEGQSTSGNKEELQVRLLEYLEAKRLGTLPEPEAAEDEEADEAEEA